VMSMPGVAAAIVVAVAAVAAALSPAAAAAEMPSDYAAAMQLTTQGGEALYRIELPVYSFQADAAAKVLPRVVTQVFTLPAPDDTVAIPIGSSR